MRGKPRQVIVDGKPMIAMSEKEFESLLATRRQLGSQTAKMRMLRDTLVEVGDFLDSVAEALDADVPPVSQEVPLPSGPRRPPPALIAEIRRRAHQMRAITGAGRTPRGRRPSDQRRT
ncbi:hypothetical protein [Streptomyces shenzhenensis]|uniref:Uncharacterized protein n=1 Tax=Streptomyces shenzhenensis TaxID=943815 RepID=A0A3M0HTH2_9ACTN|nr:hypothetical protein [Streptomyces shenzhenensis]RMB79378.1 hypothetical protein CTZ28_45935 [Streptomyces shenzhenensis]